MSSFTFALTYDSKVARTIQELEDKYEYPGTDQRSYKKSKKKRYKNKNKAHKRNAKTLNAVKKGLKSADEYTAFSR